MSQDQLVSEYLHGRISRRMLIRRLVAAGVSLGAAASYAHLLRPQAAGARMMTDLHGATLTLDIIEQPLGRVIDNGFLRVRATYTGSQFVQIFAHLYRANSTWPDAVIGYASLSWGSAGSRIVKIPLNYNPPHSLNALRRRQRAKIGVSINDTAGDVPRAACEDVTVLVR